MKKINFILLVAILGMLTSCGVGVYYPNAHNVFGAQTTVHLDKANFRVVRNVEVVVDFDNTNMRRAEAEKSAYGELLREAQLTGSQVLINVVIEEVLRKGLHRHQYVAARATIIEFLDENGNPTISQSYRPSYTQTTNVLAQPVNDVNTNVVQEVEETSEEGEEDLDLAPVEETEDENSGEEEKVEESLKESKVVEIETDQLCSVVLDNRQMFVGSEKECEDYIKENNSDPAVSAHGGFKLLKTAKVPVSKEIEESLAESKTTKQRLTVIEPGYQYKDKDGSIYTLYDDECEEDNTGLTYD